MDCISKSQKVLAESLKRVVLKVVFTAEVRFLTAVFLYTVDSKEPVKFQITFALCFLTSFSRLVVILHQSATTAAAAAAALGNLNSPLTVTKGDLLGGSRPVKTHSSS